MAHPVTSTTPGAAGEEEPTLAGLVLSATKDMSALVRAEIELAKAEIKDDVQHAAKGVGMFAGAGFLALLAVILLSIALALGLDALGLPGWLAFLVVAVLYLVIAGVLGLIGKKQVSKVSPPERTIRTAKELPQAFKPAR